MIKGEAFEGLYGPKPIKRENRMNEQIRELAESCMIEEYNQHGNLIEFGFDYEKFAESIILDAKCWIHKRIGPKTALDFLEHFGVSE